MGSGFGIDGEHSIKNNLRKITRNSAFQHRGKDAPNITLHFTSEGKFSKTELEALGLKQRQADRTRWLKVLSISFLVLVLLIGFFALIINL